VIDRIWISAFFSLYALISVSQIELKPEYLNTSLAHQVEIAEDKQKVYSLDDVLRNANLEFRSPVKEIEILDFNQSRWFVRFTVFNPSSEKTIYLETARPITDKVDLFEIYNGYPIQSWHSGDSRQFDKKTYAHRKNIFPIKFKAEETKSFYLVMESDGEVINLPVIFWDKDEFLKVDYRNQLLHGLYFGMLAVVIFIFFIFYVLLKEISFLYYILYVFFQFMLQFSLEGFSFQYIFPNQPCWANNSVLLSAGFTTFFVVLYSIAFLKIKYRIPTWYRIFRVLLVLIALTTAMTLTTGVLHVIAYPAINVLSLLVILAIVYLIIKLTKSGYSINKAFTLGFILLIVGAIIFILGNLGIFGDARISELSLKISSGLEILALSVSMAGKYRELQREKELAQEKALEKLEQLVEERTEEVRMQKEHIEEQNKDILDSIHYAQRIQNAILPVDNLLQSVAQKHFLFYQPRDIVSGDFYFAAKLMDEKQNDWDVLAAVDCTGHGVPGAFMSIIGNNLLNDAILKQQLSQPGKILEFMNKGLIDALNMDSKESGAIRDGMDMALLLINRKAQIIRFAGAKNGMYWLCANSSAPAQEFSDLKRVELDGVNRVLLEIKADKKPIGTTEGEEQYEQHEFRYSNGDRFYIFSDGFADQFGEDDNGKVKKFGSKRMKELILESSNMAINEQGELLKSAYHSWKNNEEALDDVLVIGVEV
jgi:two-component system, sensor histidine kinase LadS